MFQHYQDHTGATLSDSLGGSKDRLMLSNYIFNTCATLVYFTATFPFP
jgi:hypothetical protein